MASIAKAAKNKATRDPLFFAKRANYVQQAPKPDDCSSCPFAKHPYGWEEAPLYSGVTGDVIPTDVLIIMPGPTVSDVDDAKRMGYATPFGSAHSRRDGNSGSKAWSVYRAVIERLKHAHQVNVRTIYAVPCKGPKEAPASVTAYCGVQYLQRKIPLYQPKAILCLGGVALRALGETVPAFVSVRGTIQMYKSCISDAEIPLVITYDPSAYFFPTGGNDYSAIERFVCDFEKAVKLSRGQLVKVDHAEFEKKLLYPETDEEISQVVDSILSAHRTSPVVLAFDIETTGLWHWYDAEHAALLNERQGLSSEFLERYHEEHGKSHPKEVLPAEILAVTFAWGPEKAAAILTRGISETAWAKIKELLESEIPKVAQNGKFDMAYLRAVKGIKVAAFLGDTQLNEHLIDENRAAAYYGEYSLKKLVWDYFPEFGGYEKLGGVYANISQLAHMTRDELSRMRYYAVLDALLTWRLYRKQYYALNNCPEGAPITTVTRRFSFARNHLSRASTTIADLEYNGLRIDRQVLREMSSKASELLVLETAKMKDLLCAAGSPSLNIGSVTQLEKFLYDTLGYPVLTRTATGKRSTDAKTLAALGENDQTGFVATLLNIRKLEKLKSGFLESWANLMKGDRVYPVINLDGTVTGRLSMKDPNVQTAPAYYKFKQVALAHGLPEDYFNLKRLFIPDDGCVLLISDFSQMEVRILAAYCPGGKLEELLKQGAGLDVHSMLAAQIAGISYEDFVEARSNPAHPKHADYELQRQQTKSVTFTIVYGGTPYTLNKKNNISEAQGTQLFQDFFRTFPEVQEYIAQTHAMARRLKYVTTYFGRRRHLPILAYVPSNRALRQAQNSRIQSTASDVCVVSVLDLHEQLGDLGGRVLTTVHDSVVSQVPIDKAVEGYNYTIRCMIEDPAQRYPWLTVPLHAEVQIGTSWGDAVKIKSPDSLTEIVSRLTSRA